MIQNKNSGKEFINIASGHGLNQMQIVEYDGLFDVWGQ